jgi:hypothetical protein
MSNKLISTPACPHCKLSSLVSVNEDDYILWHTGAQLQDAFPYLDLETRELLKTGFHDSCWKAVFGNDD